VARVSYEAPSDRRSKGNRKMSMDRRDIDRMIETQRAVERLYRSFGGIEHFYQRVSQISQAQRAVERLYRSFGGSSGSMTE
jgi:hypothetical protein